MTSKKPVKYHLMDVVQLRSSDKTEDEGMEPKCKDSDINEFVKIGQYSIERNGYLGLWIYHESGEGVEVKEADLEKAIEKYYKEHF